MTDDRPGSPAVTYGSYLQIDALLELQKPRSEGPEHDEMLFIVIHQVYELWFKQLLHELDRVAELLRTNDAVRAQHTLKRILTILKVLVAQLDILETMTPLEFLSFRSRLEAASGFQSDQFRQIEFLLGQKSQAAVERFGAATRARAALERRWREPTLWDAFLGYLQREGYPIPQARLDRDPTAAVEPSPDVQRILVDVYRRDPRNSELCERLVDLDEGIQECATGTSRWWSARSASNAAPAAQQERSTCRPPSPSPSFRTCGKSEENSRPSSFFLPPSSFRTAEAPFLEGLMAGGTDEQRRARRTQGPAQGQGEAGRGRSDRQRPPARRRRCR
jgi:tryptophan 2,3-dioxygenase